MSFYFQVALNSLDGGIGEGDGTRVSFMVQEQKVMGSIPADANSSLENQRLSSFLC